MVADAIKPLSANNAAAATSEIGAMEISEKSFTEILKPNLELKDQILSQEKISSNLADSAANNAVSATPSPTITKQRRTTPGLKRDLLNLQSDLNPKYITMSNSDDKARSKRRRRLSPALNISVETEAQDKVNDLDALDSSTPANTPTLLPDSSKDDTSPIVRLIMKNGGSVSNSTGFEDDVAEIARGPQIKQIKRTSKRGSKPKTRPNEVNEEKASADVSQTESEQSFIVENPVASEKVADDVNEAIQVPTQIIEESSVKESSEAKVDITKTEVENIEKIQEHKTEKNVAGDTLPNTADDFESPQHDLEFAKPLRASTVVIQYATDLLQSPPLVHTDVENSMKSPSSISLDSAKGSSIVTDSGWTSYHTGDLYWGRIYSYCYWPCMVCPDPDGQLVTSIGKHPSRNSTDSAPFQIQIHMRFFADNGRRNWIKQENLMPFAGFKAYIDMRDEIEAKFGTRSVKFRQWIPKKNQIQTWHKAVEEANIVLEMPHDQRLEKFFEIYESALTIMKKRRKRTYSMMQDTSDVGSSLYNSTDNLANTMTFKRERSDSPLRPAYSPVKHNHEVKRRRYSNTAEKVINSNTENNFMDKPTDDMTEGEAETELLRNNEYAELLDAMRQYVMHTNDGNVDLVLQSVVRNVWSLKKLQLKDAERNLSLGYETVESASLEHDKGLRDVRKLSYRLKSIREKYDRHSVTKSLTPTPALPERRLSEQPKIKKELNRPIEEVVQDILNLDRKYLFKGLTKDNFCKYCYETGGNLSRCSLGCNSWLHAACLNPTKTKPNKSSKKAIKALQALGTPALEAESSPSPISDMDALHPEMQQENIICRECATNAPETCCICLQAQAPPTTPPASPVKATAEEPHSSTSVSSSALETKNTLIACSLPTCNKKFHPDCCKHWPQAKVNQSTSRCPMHVCHICVSEDPRAKFQQLGNAKLTKCVLCPATYHIDSHCIPAGSRLINMTNLICPRHNVSKADSNVNVLWCYMCASGGNLLCCETCPHAVHDTCHGTNLKPNENYICEGCEVGRLPLYGEIIWAKFNNFRWWPAIILPPTEIPTNILKKIHGPNEFVVRFFGSHDHGWISRRRVYLYETGDATEKSRSKSQLNKPFEKGLAEAARFFEIINAMRLERSKANNGDSKQQPPPYVKLKTNRPVPPVRLVFTPEDISVCECKPSDENPCGPESGCLNRILFHECNANYCPAGDRCENRVFLKRKSPRFDVVYMKERGFGLVSREFIAEGSFVIEYVGEVINHEEFSRRMAQMQRDKVDNYYFLEVEKDFIIDAGPKGNMARFMNHSCDPNCASQKWTVNSIHRIGLFAVKDIPPDTELTFNYLWDDLMSNERKDCYCGATTCSGKIGKLKEETAKESTTAQPSKTKKRVQPKKSNPVRSKKPTVPKTKAKHISADDDLEN